MMFVAERGASLALGTETGQRHYICGFRLMADVTEMG